MAKSKATCRVAVLGEARGFLMLPRCVVDSAAYRDLSVYARAVLVEIGSRLDGFNNGRIGIDQRTIMESLRCRPANVVEAVADLMEHGLIDVSAEGSLATKKAREYRLTFVSTPNAPATNDYLRWTADTPSLRKSCATDAVTAKPRPATTVVTGTRKSATDVVTAKIKNGGKPSPAPASSATTVVSHICKPYPPAPSGERRGDTGSSIHTLPASGLQADRKEMGLGEVGDHRACDRCGSDFVLDRADRFYPRRFCSTRCRKQVENIRARERRHNPDGEAETIGNVLTGTIPHLLARAAA